MHKIGKMFFTAALVYGLLGIALGLHMAISHDHAQMPTHAHILVIGWVSFAIFGLFYGSYGAATPAMLSRLHFWLAQISMAGLVIGLGLLYAGETRYEPIAAAASLGYAASFLLFIWIALTTMRELP